MSISGYNSVSCYHQALSVLMGNRQHRDISSYYRLKQLIQEALKLYSSEYVVLGPDLHHLEMKYIEQIKDCIRQIGDEFEPNIKGLPPLSKDELAYLKSTISDNDGSFLLKYEVAS